ncbi:M56 family metallopeptidase, partial [Pyxidicoccus fallax]
MSSLLMESLGWALLHSLWQGALVALLLVGALALVGRRAAHARYALACGALVLSLALPVVSGWRHYSEARALEASSVEPAPRSWVLPGVAARGAEDANSGRVAVVGTVTGDGELATRGAGDAAVLREAATEVPLLERVRAKVAEHLQWLVLAWVAGVGLCSGRMVAEWVKLRRLAREAVAAPVEWQQRLDALAKRLGLERAVRLLQSSAVDVPAAVGWLSPVVLLPVSALSGLSTRQLEMVLAHELAHIRRHDFAVNLAQVLVETLLFYHPAVRWVSQVIRVERENCCDDIAVGASGGAVSYARALTALEMLRVQPGTPGPAMSALGGSLPERVRRLVLAPAPRCSSRWVAGASVLTLASSLAVAAPLTSLMLDREDPAERDGTPATPPSTSRGADARPGVGDLPLPGASLASNTEAGDLLNPPSVIARPTAPGRPASPPSAPPAGGIAPPAVIAPISGALAAPAAPVASAPAPIPGAPAAPAPAPGALAAPAPALIPGTRAAPAPSPVPGALAVPAPAPAPGARAAPAPAPVPGVIAAPAPAPSPRAKDDDADARTRVGAGQPLSVDQLIALKMAGVTPARVKELESMGYAPTVANLVSMGHAGVTPEYAKEMNARFGRALDADDLVELKHLGVTPAYLAALASAGFTVKDPDDVTDARAVGVDEAYVRELKTTGYSGLSLEDVTQLRAVGVDPAYIKALGQRGLSKLSADDLTELRAVGVTPEWLDQMRAGGVQTKDADDLTQLRALGVTPDFLRELRDAG